MGLEGELRSIASGLAGQAAELEEKIRRLRQAKSEVAREQSAGLSEIGQIRKPELADQWMGNRSSLFDEDRKEAYNEMKRIFEEEYTEYQSEIEQKIGWLEIELASIRALQATASAIGDMIDKGEEMLEQAGNMLADLKRGIFG